MRRLVVCCGVLLLGLLATSNASAALRRWGAYGSTRVGMESEPSDVTLPPEAGNVVKVDAGNAATYVLTDSGQVWSLGKNNNGELGIGTKGEPELEPVQAQFPAGVHITAIGEGHGTGYAVDSTGQGWAWGREQTEGSEPATSLCLGEQSRDVLTPTKVPGLTGARAVQGGDTHAIWLLQDGTVETCGSNYQGALGIGTTTPTVSYVPVSVPGLSGVVEVSAGQAINCARTASGAVYIWGGDRNGQVGNGHALQAGVFSPFHVPLPGPASQISCGGNYGTNGHVLVIVGGVVYGWGDDESGQIGDGLLKNKLSPTVSSKLTSLGLKQVVASGEYSLGVDAAGNVWGWGDNKEHTIAQPKSAANYLKPVLIDTGATEVSATAFDSFER